MIETIATIRKSNFQEFRVELFSTPGNDPMLRLRLYDRDGDSDELLPRPGACGIPKRLAAEIATGMQAGAKRIGEIDP